MRTVLLYGHLGRQFGKYHRFDVASPAEAVRALCANFRGFEQAMVNHAPGYHLFRGEENLARDQLKQPSGRDAIRIVPVIAGAKHAGVLQIIEGIVIIVAAAVYGYFSGDVDGAIAGAKFGGAMIFGGVLTYLFSPPPPNLNPTEANAANQPSYVFNGPVNTTAQGHPVPVGYGRLTVGSAVISGGIYVAQIDQAGNIISGGVTEPTTPDADTTIDSSNDSGGFGTLRVGEALNGYTSALTTSV